MNLIASFLDILRCPATGARLVPDGASLATEDKKSRYRVTGDSIPIFAETAISREADAQRRHYDSIAATYTANLNYPHTQEYLAYLDRVLLDASGAGNLGTVVELCCGRGEGLSLFGGRMRRYVGVDVSERMLGAARGQHNRPDALFVQADATRTPLAGGSADTVVMLGGVHHVPGRAQLFAEIARILRPGGRFLYREPASDFFIWRFLRAIVYRLSPMLNHDTERPLVYAETVPLLRQAGLTAVQYRTYGLLGFCLFMNSDVLVVNRLFRFVPGIRGITRAFVKLDDAMVRLPGFARAGLQVIGIARKEP